MQWYVSKGGVTKGPIEEGTIMEWGKGGLLTPDVFVRDGAGGNWTPIGQSPFAGLVPGSAVAGVPAGGELLGVVAMLLPVGSTLLIWFWIARMNLLQDPGGALLVLNLLTVIGTAVLIATEASLLGMGKRLNTKGDKDSGPITWFFAVCLMWLIAFPWYLDTRRKYGRTPLAVGGILVALLFTVSSLIVGSAIARM
jgi:hypothetical protein